MTNIATPPKLQFFDANGAPLASGKLYTYAAGTTTPLATYTSSTGGTANANPVILDSRGEASVWFGTSQYKLVLKTSADVEIWTVDNLNGADMVTYDAVLAALAASGGAALVGYIGGSAGAVATTIQSKLRQYVHVADYGAVGDNSTDDYTAIVSAATAAAAQGTQLVFDGTKTYKINQDTLTLPAGLNVRFNGAVLNFTKTQGSNTNPAVVITGPFNADFLRVNIPTGVVRNYGIIAEGNNVSIPRITLTSTDVQPQLAAAGDYGVKFANGARFLCDRIVTTNFDRAVVIDTTTDSTIGGINVDSYVRGVYEVDNTRLKIGASVIKTRSPNASNTAGHNGFLSSGGTNNTFEDFTVLDAGEEGIRIGGGPQQNVMLVRPRVKDAQANAIKVLGTSNTSPVVGEYQQNLFIIDPICEDCGTSGGSEDRNGILIQRSIGVQITNPIIRKRDNTYSAVYGILVYASEDVNITNPIIQDAQYSGIYMLTDINSNVADLSRVDVIGGMVTDCGTDGLQISSTASATIRNVNVTGIKLFGNGRRGATLAAGSGGTFISCFLNAQFYGNTETTITSTSTGWMLDCFGVETYGTSPTSFASITAANSSRWSNETSFYVLKAGTWTAL